MKKIKPFKVSVKDILIYDENGENPISFEELEKMIEDASGITDTLRGVTSRKE
jgi:hypothetical protein